MRRVRKSQKRKSKKAKKVRSAKRAKRSARNTLKRAIRRLLPDSIFTSMTKHGNSQWSLGVLSFVALFWAFSGETTLGERYVFASEIATHWFPGEFLASSYRGFMNALVRHNAALMKGISERLRKRMLELDDGRGRIAGLIPFVVDGSQVGAPWTRANEETLGKKGRKPQGAKCQKKQTDLRPQLTLTMLWHMNLGLPWAWKHGGRRAHPVPRVVGRLAPSRADRGGCGVRGLCVVAHDLKRRPSFSDPRRRERGTASRLGSGFGDRARG